MLDVHTITPCLWFDNDAEPAAQFYVTLFPHSKIHRVSRYPEAGSQVDRVPGSVMTVDFALAGHRLTALNGGPAFSFSPAISMQVSCHGQDELDHYWHALSEGGDPSAQQCGWLKDRFGLSWQIVPNEMKALFDNDDPKRAQRVMLAMLSMKKIDLAALRRAATG